MESIVESCSQIVSVAGNLFTVFGVHRMVAEGARSNQKLLALREKGVYSSYTSRHGAKPSPNHQVNLTAYSFTRFCYIGSNWHRAILNDVPSIRRPSYLFRYANKNIFEAF
jgi:hypothetical protein